MKKIIILLVLLLLFSGCSVTICSEEEERDNAIEECKQNGGKPYVENYNDSMLRPIVHCIFENKGSDKE